MISHLVELRKRLLRYVLILLLAFGLCSWQSDLLFSILSAPLRHALGPHPMMVFTAPHEAFGTYLRVGIFFSFFLTFPWLLAEVWGYGFDPRSNVVDVCVRRLRVKLGPDAPIETVRHAGYRLVAA